MRSRRLVFVALYAASGAAALVYEVTWTRLLTLLMGHTVAAASTVLGAVMGGLAVGSWIGARFERRMSAAASDCPGATRLRWYATLEIVVALAAVALPLPAGRPHAGTRVGLQRRGNACSFRARSPRDFFRRAGHSHDGDGSDLSNCRRVVH